MIYLLKNLITNLSYIIFIVFIISNVSIFKNIIQKEQLKKLDLFILSITFSIFGIISTYMGTDVNGAIANTRIIGIIAGGILYGPFVGIISGIVTGIHRFIYDIGGITSIPCAITTILSGFFAAYIYKKCNKFNKWLYGFICGFITESIEMFLILIMSKPYSNALSIVKSIYLPMSFTNALGISFLIILIEKTLNEKEQIAAKQAQLALEIANKTLPYFRDINKNSLSNICSIIKDSTGAAAVEITDKNTILAHVGLGYDHHKIGNSIQTASTNQVIKNGSMKILNSANEIQCFYKNCPLKSAIILPIKDGDEVKGTLKLYYSKENGISYTNEKLAIGLSQIISTQLEISKIGKLKEMAAKAEIKALQAQINPHFLFNALNTIASFIRFNPNKARELIINLSFYLRYNMEKINTFVELEKEIEQVKAYVEIEKARFGNKINIIYDIDKSIKIKIPSLIIQPLVENSIKHGILEGSGYGTVKIAVKKHNLKDVIIIVEDDGIGIPNHIINSVYSNNIKENKIGLANVNNRLKLIYNSGLIIERLNTGTKISFIIH
ncbi:two-component system, LytT family, sensor kinase [Clostridium sp. USBA 49]|uniref:sensor histidine kinase n=1 Tax=Clostridium sp. USBA 49 TaxID=1881060 RepID=UPI0009993DAD|nr:sensor histidine kinase [Clostridium sp. USBA 49]SKA73096.1 two-component system, LytT family, sensor kinase [Clostridium sp. USBA 49]